MTTINKELYTALKATGASEDQALAAAEGFLPVDEIATKHDLMLMAKDLKNAIKEMGNGLTWRFFGMLLGMQFGFSALVVTLIKLL